MQVEGALDRCIGNNQMCADALGWTMHPDMSVVIATRSRTGLAISERVGVPRADRAKDLRSGRRPGGEENGLSRPTRQEKRQ